MRQAGRPPIRIAGCAPDPVLRERIESALLLGGHELAGWAESIAQLLDVSRETDPGAIVLACQLEPFTRSREIAGLREQLPDVPLVIVAAGFLTAAARAVLRGEAHGLLHETELERVLVATIDSVLADQLCVPASLRGAFAAPVFSHREKQVLQLVVAGLSNGEIAGRLYLSESTVKSHLASSFRKLGVSSRGEAATRARHPDVGLDLAAVGPESRFDPGPSFSLQ